LAAPALQAEHAAIEDLFRLLAPDSGSLAGFAVARYPGGGIVVENASGPFPGLGREGSGGGEGLADGLAAPGVPDPGQLGLGAAAGLGPSGERDPDRQRQQQA